MSKKKAVPPKKTVKGLSAAAEPGGEPLRVQIDRFAVALPLRDMFAAAALAGMLANSDFTGGPRFYSQEAYNVADAMMETRK